MIVDPVTQRYADALWGLAKAKGSLPVVVQDVERLSGSLSTKSVRDAIVNPRVAREQRRATLSSVTTGMHPFVANLVGLLFDKNREEVLLLLGDAFKKLRLEEAGQVEGVVESARPLGPAEMSLIATQLRPQFGKELVLTNAIHPDLVGGARVIAANRMIDYSVQGRLDALRRKMMDAPLPGVRG